MNVIDVIAPTLARHCSTRSTASKTKPDGKVLHTAGAQIDRVEMGLWKSILDLLVDPNLIALMLSIGVLGIVVELWNPGLVFPGTVGADLADRRAVRAPGAADQRGRAAADAARRRLLRRRGFIVSHGALALAGAICFFIGALMLFDPAGEAYQVSTGSRSRSPSRSRCSSGSRPRRSGRCGGPGRRPGSEELVGQAGIVRRPLDPEGYVRVHGELWRARAENGPIAAGEPVEVAGIDDGLVLEVRRTVRPAPVEA